MGWEVLDRDNEKLKPISNWESDDLLNRKKCADFLTNYLTKRYATYRVRGDKDTYVLSVRAEWGFGKTFFIRRWMKDLSDNGFPVVYFDAWINDFSQDPMVGFINEMNEGLDVLFKKKPVAKKLLNKTIGIGKRLAKPVGVSAVAFLSRQLTGLTLDQFKDLLQVSGEERVNIEGAVSALAEASADAIFKEHREVKGLISDFKNSLKELVNCLEAESGIQLPIFIFVDELDRCRPNYAIELLEAIKHLFGVEGIYFIVSTNLDQLGHSIKAVYGDGFDSERYLKRFFDSEYILPNPDNTSFCKFLFEKYQIGKSSNIFTAIQNGLYEDNDDEIRMFCLVCDFFGVSLRDREQIANALFATLTEFYRDERVHFSYLVFLLVVKHVSSHLFERISMRAFNAELSFYEALSEHCKAEVMIKGRSAVSSSVSRPADFQLRGLFWEYYKAAGKTIREVYDARDEDAEFPQFIYHFIEQPSRTRAGNSNPLATYFERVMHAGQLV